VEFEPALASQLDSAATHVEDAK
ncbi:hypothetical protein E3A20_18980, partial [Planctomyces bekefii]